MKKKYILALDQGTSSSRSILFDKEQNIIGTEQEEFKQFYPQINYVEQNPHEIWESQYLTAKTLLTKHKIKTEEIAGIGITNQRETTIVWDKNTGEPIYNAIVWQDKRTTEYCLKLKSGKNDTYIKNNTGLLIDAYFSATKIRWILNNVEGAKAAAKKGDLLFGTVDTWLVWKLSGGKLHVTDYSNASRTLLFNIHSLEWDKNLLKLFDIPEKMLPEVRNSSEIYGHTTKELFGTEIPIAGIAGDQQAALFGQQCFTPGETKNTYGTGCFMLMNTGEKPVHSKHGLLTTLAWGIDNKATYALEGSVFMAGAIIKWLRDGIKLIKSAGDTEQIALQKNDNEGVYFVPAFAGLGAPYWNPDARGIIVGLTQGSSEYHIVRASLESIAYQTKDVLEAMSKDSGINLKSLNVDGGVSVNNFLMQFQADILNIEVLRPELVETTAAGAGFLAGLAVGFWTKENLIKKRKINRIFSPEMPEDKRTELYKAWLSAVKKAMIHE